MIITTTMMGRMICRSNNHLVIAVSSTRHAVGIVDQLVCGRLYKTRKEFVVMSRMPQQNWFGGGFPPHGQMPPRPPRRRRVRWRFRWGLWILFPLICLACFVVYWLLSNVSLDIDFSMDNMFGSLPVSNPRAFGQLLLLAIGLIVIVLIIRLLRRP